jgi:RNA polymerase sigma-70 factor (ECF subfamily)
MFFLAPLAKFLQNQCQLLTASRVLPMDSVSASRTSATLLGKLRLDPTDETVWAEFVERYGPKVYEWCRRWNLSDADAEDVTQNVLIVLARKMGDFAYDPSKSFRGWLKTLTRHAWSDFLQMRSRPGRGSGDSRVAHELESIEARDDLVARLNAEFDHELLEEASVRVRLRVEPRTWEAFYLTAVERLSGAETGAKLGMQVVTVFKAKSKVQKMLREELHNLELGSD